MLMAVLAVLVVSVAVLGTDLDPDDIFVAPTSALDLAIPNVGDIIVLG